MSKIIEPKPADEELIKAIKQNDPEAFKEFYYRYFKMLVRFASYRVPSIETATDLVQDLFLKLWTSRSNLNPAKSVKAYLYKSINNSIINHNKLYSLRTTSIGNIGDDKIKRVGSNPDIKLDVQNAITHLPEKLKIVFILSRFEGYKYSEIAQICDISVKAVEKRMSKTFDILRKVLSE